MSGETGATTVSGVLDIITDVVSEGSTWLQSAGTAIVGSPLAMVCFGISLVGIGFGLFRRLMSIF